MNLFRRSCLTREKNRKRMKANHLRGLTSFPPKLVDVVLFIQLAFLKLALFT